ncbi:MAG TPA: LuxR C-terminal-related transcriptional regulator [Pseudomonas sp.]
MASHEAAAPVEGVVRHDLLQRLDACRKLPLTLLLAPAGSGKSTLLEQWRRFNGILRPLHIALQARDNDPQRFFRRLVEMVRTRHPTFDTSWFDPLDLPRQQSPERLGEALGEALARLPGELFIVLDDFQWVDSPTILAGFQGLFASPPGNVHWLIGTRNQPAFGLARLKLDGHLHCVDQQDLRLDASQVRQLNEYLGGGELSDDYIASLLAMTEGWLGGIKVALLAYARYGVAALERFDGSQPDIVDYFGHVVLRQLSPELRDFFLCSSVFERFDGQACDQVLQRSGSALLLEQLAARQLFMLPLESGGFRYHALLHDFLALRLQLERPHLIGELHRRACAFFLSRDDHEQSIQHALRSADRALLRATLQRACDSWLALGQFGEIIRWLALLEEAELRAEPSLGRLLIAALTLSRRFHQARYYLELVPLEALSREFLEQQLLLFQEERLEGTESLWRRLGDSSAPLELRAMAQCMLAYRDLLAGHLRQALRQATQAKELLAQGGQGFLESYADLIIALGERNAGRATTARKVVCADYQRTARQSPAWVNRATAMVVALYEQNQLGEAQQLSEDLIASLIASSATEAIATVHIILARLLHRRQQGAAASRLLERLGGILSLGSYPRFDGQLAQEAMRQAYLDGRQVALENLAQQYRLAERLERGEWARARHYDEAWERLGLACVYWLCSRGAQQRALRLMRVLVQALRGSEMRARALVAEALLLVLSAAEQPRRQQLSALRQLVEDYGIVNISRSVFDEVPGFAGQVLGLVSAGQLAIPERYRDSYGEFLPGAVAPQRDMAMPPERLTDKEEEIVECLVAGLSNQQISDRTGIALSTTKWHLKNIYAKLDVNSRTQAILKVRS